MEKARVSVDAYVQRRKGKIVHVNSYKKNVLAAVMQELDSGQTVKLPDGQTVTKTPEGRIEIKDRHGYEVSTAAHGRVHNYSPRQMRRVAADQVRENSRTDNHPKSLGGATRFPSKAAADRAERLRGRQGAGTLAGEEAGKTQAANYGTGSTKPASTSDLGAVNDSNAFREEKLKDAEAHAATSPTRGISDRKKKKSHAERRKEAWDAVSIVGGESKDIKDRRAKRGKKPKAGGANRSTAARRQGQAVGRASRQRQTAAEAKPKKKYKEDDVVSVSGFGLARVVGMEGDKGSVRVRALVATPRAQQRGTDDTRESERIVSNFEVDPYTGDTSQAGSLPPARNPKNMTDEELDAHVTDMWRKKQNAAAKHHDREKKRGKDGFEAPESKAYEEKRRVAAAELERRAKKKFKEENDPADLKALKEASKKAELLSDIKQAARGTGYKRTNIEAAARKAGLGARDAQKLKSIKAAIDKERNKRDYDYDKIMKLENEAEAITDAHAVTLVPEKYSAKEVAKRIKTPEGMKRSEKMENYYGDRGGAKHRVVRFENDSTKIEVVLSPNYAGGYQMGSGHVSFRTGKDGPWYSFDRRGVDDSFYVDSPLKRATGRTLAHDDPSIDPAAGANKAIQKYITERIPEAIDRRQRSTSVPGIPFSVTPEKKKSVSERLKRDGGYSFMPGGFGTGYRLTTSKPRGGAARKGPTSLARFFGVPVIYIETFDAD